MMRHLLFGLVLLSSLAAHAQTAGSCTGAMMGSFGIGVRRNGNIVSVNSTDVATVFGQAECLCDDPDTDTNDLQMEILLNTLLPADTVGASLEVWVGNGCDTYANRTNPSQTTCQQLLNTKLSTQMFLTGVASTNVVIRAPISASALSQPKVGGCTGSSLSRGIWIFIYRMPETPLATCSMQLTVNNTGPTAPIETEASPGDSAVSVTWKPPATSTGPLPSKYFQLLCANEDGTPIAGKRPSIISYSSCLPGGTLEQRNNLPIGGNSTNTNSDLGTSTSLDMSLGTNRFRPLAAGDDMGTNDDASVSDDGGSTADMAPAADLLPPTSGYRGATTTSLPAPFTNLDPAYVCSEQRDATSATSFSERITGLTNGATYKFVILAVDTNGNATPSQVLEAKPAPVENFYRRYANEGGTASGFCSATNGGFGASELTMLGLLALLLGVYHRRRLAAWWESLR